MTIVKEENFIPPPRVIPTLKAGFDMAASHLSILIMPVLLDLFLWFGPRLSINRLLGMMSEQLKMFGQQDLVPVAELKQIQDSIQTLMGLDINLFSLLRTLPIGVSSIMAQAPTTATPLGVPHIQYLENAFVLIFWIFALTVAGWALGSIYFTWVAKVSLQDKSHDLRWAGKSMLRSFLLSILWAVVALVIGTPLLVVFSLFSQISPTITEFAIIFLLLFSMWLIVPFFFSAHGIFTQGENVFRSIISSLHLSRYTLPTSSFFVLGVLILSQGFNALWLVPETASWMMLVGIVGHAFITTALLAASFIYYKDMSAWLEVLLERLESKKDSVQA